MSYDSYTSPQNGFAPDWQSYTASNHLTVHLVCVTKYRYKVLQGDTMLC